MARDYSKVGWTFWTGKTGRAIRALNRPDVQVIALYLLTCKSATMTGLYYLPVTLMAHETGSPFEGASEALSILVQLGFCALDSERDLVWVCEMARFQIGEELSKGDKRIPAIIGQLQEHAASPLALLFVRKYQAAYHLPSLVVASGLKDGRSPEGPYQGPREAPSKGHTETLRQTDEAPSKPESREQRTDLERETPRACAPPLVMRRRLHAAYEWERGCVPQDLHADLVAKLGGDAAEANRRLLALYVEVASTWPTDAPVGNDWAFWRARFDEAFVPKPARAVVPAPSPAAALPTGHAFTWVCDHEPRCGHRRACAVVTARDVQAGRLALGDVQPALRPSVEAALEPAEVRA